jgi:hypothetical protein
MALETQKTNLPIEEFVKRVFLHDLRGMIYEARLQYLAFGIIAVGIAFLGACMDAYPFNESGHSPERFDRGVQDFLSTSDARYRQYNDVTSPYRLYKHLRCGMAHVMRPQGKVLFTSRDESTQDGTKHLEIINDQLLFVCEDFYDHFASACQLLVDRLPSLKSSKLERPYLVITEFS